LGALPGAEKFTAFPQIQRADRDDGKLEKTFFDTSVKIGAIFKRS
jgi:hypothetical protein